MSDTIIRAENLGKKYQINHKKTEKYVALRDVVSSKIHQLKTRVTNNKKPAYSKKEDFWALKNISFEIKRGDRVGIIGRNGAGKSTLLKILSRITEPTTGCIELYGRVASLLEVGTGFHPELTGRENILLNGAILGMSKVEILRKFDEIVYFSEVEKFLDTPVKRYSSGMYVRLAFSVAAHLEPEILLIDEVLAVGDIQFQKKCLGKIKDVGKEGRTVIFVSHNMSALQSLCDSAFLLSEGSLLYKGDVNESVKIYSKFASQDTGRSGEIYWDRNQSTLSTKIIRLRSVRLLDEGLSTKGYFDASEPIQIEISYEIISHVRDMRFILKVVNAEGIVVFASTDHNLRGGRHEKLGYHKTTCVTPPNLMKEGLYFLQVSVGCPGVESLIESKECIEFCIEGCANHGSFYSESWPGIVSPKMVWRLNDSVPTQKQIATTRKPAQ